MEIGEPVRTVIVRPEREPIPTFAPDREPLEVPREEPVFDQPEKVQP